MKSVLIVENSTNSLSLNENNSQKDQFILGGIFTEFDIKNRNERITDNVVGKSHITNFKE